MGWFTNDDTGEVEAWKIVGVVANPAAFFATGLVVEGGEVVGEALGKAAWEKHEKDREELLNMTEDERKAELETNTVTKVVLTITSGPAAVDNWEKIKERNQRALLEDKSYYEILEEDEGPDAPLIKAMIKDGLTSNWVGGSVSVTSKAILGEETHEAVSNAAYDQIGNMLGVCGMSEDPRVSTICGSVGVFLDAGKTIENGIVGYVRREKRVWDGPDVIKDGEVVQKAGDVYYVYPVDKMEYAKDHAVDTAVGAAFTVTGAKYLRGAKLLNVGAKDVKGLNNFKSAKGFKDKVKVLWKNVTKKGDDVTKNADDAAGAGKKTVNEIEESVGKVDDLAKERKDLYDQLDVLGDDKIHAMEQGKSKAVIDAYTKKGWQVMDKIDDVEDLQKASKKELQAMADEMGVTVEDLTKFVDNYKAMENAGVKVGKLMDDASSAGSKGWLFYMIIKGDIDAVKDAQKKGEYGTTPMSATEKKGITEPSEPKDTKKAVSDIHENSDTIKESDKTIQNSVATSEKYNSIANQAEQEETQARNNANIYMDRVTADQAAIDEANRKGDKQWAAAAQQNKNEDLVMQLDNLDAADDAAERKEKARETANEADVAKAQAEANKKQAEADLAKIAGSSEADSLQADADRAKKKADETRAAAEEEKKQHQQNAAQRKQNKAERDADPENKAARKAVKKKK
jgi:hypothetical protein